MRMYEEKCLNQDRYKFSISCSFTLLISEPFLLQVTIGMIEAVRSLTHICHISGISMTPENYNEYSTYSQQY